MKLYRSDTLFEFGKYKGKKISDLPDDYIIWMFENLVVTQPLKDAINKEMESRSL